MNLPSHGSSASAIFISIDGVKEKGYDKLLEPAQALQDAFGRTKPELNQTLARLDQHFTQWRRFRYFKPNTSAPWTSLAPVPILY